MTTPEEQRNQAAAPAFVPPASADKKDGGNQEEEQYLNIVRDVLTTGVSRSDRTGVGTLSKFGTMMRFSLRNGRIPLLTTKSVFWKGVVEELLWMLRGSTNSQELDRKGVGIWNANGSREFLDKCGFTNRQVGDLGPVYGFQWRHFGAKFVNSDTDYKGQGVDQIAQIIELLKKYPDSRRIVMSAWNPVDIPYMVLPPCHVSAQFTVTNGELSCLMTQRSADLGLGVPFNIASYSLLTHILAHITSLKPGEFVYSLGDYHIYKNQIKGLEIQSKRIPTEFPTLSIKRKVEDPADYRMEDFVLVGYHPQTAIKMPLAV